MDASLSHQGVEGGKRKGYCGGGSGLRLSRLGSTANSSSRFCIGGGRCTLPRRPAARFARCVRPLAMLGVALPLTPGACSLVATRSRPGPGRRGPASAHIVRAGASCPPGTNVLVVGSGGREHALTWKLAQSDLAGTIYWPADKGGKGTT